jgi:hypothetical protein
VKWDLDGTAVIVSLGVNVKRKYEQIKNLDDPNQPKLELEEVEKNRDFRDELVN